MSTICQPKRKGLQFKSSETLIVPKVGIEPTRPKAHEFESCASTSSATSAKNIDSLK